MILKGRTRRVPTKIYRLLDLTASQASETTGKKKEKELWKEPVYPDRKLRRIHMDKKILQIEAQQKHTQKPHKIVKS